MYNKKVQIKIKCMINKIYNRTKKLNLNLIVTYNWKNKIITNKLKVNKQLNNKIFKNNQNN